jgi:hypothetical protein
MRRRALPGANLINPLVSIAFAFLGLRMPRRVTADTEPAPSGPKAEDP